MKRLLLPLLLGLVVAGAAGAATAAVVQVKAASLYASDSATSKFLGKVPWGVNLTVVTQKGGWAQVKTNEKPSRTGWLRVESYTTRTSDLKTGAVGNTTTGKEVSLAGRGFGPELEADYRGKNPHLDWSVLDRLEAAEVRDEDLTAFLKAGGLKPDGRRK